MKNARFIFVLLLLINYTTDRPQADEKLEITPAQQDSQNCIDDVPRINLTNIGTHSYNLMIYNENYVVLHTQDVSTNTESGWIELSDDDILVVATNNFF